MSYADYVIEYVYTDEDGEPTGYLIRWISGPKAGETEYVDELPELG